MPTTEQSLEQAYFEWLLSQVRSQHGSQTYRELCWELYKREFVPIIHHDDNRVEDGLDLLVEFFHEMGLETENVRVGRSCSFLELIVVLARHLTWVAGGDPVDAAWTLLGNIGFHSLSDPLTDLNVRYINDVVERVVWRTYKKDGTGGFFPLAWPERDQRKVELWYQLNAYAEENMDPHETHPL